MQGLPRVPAVNEALNPGDKEMGGNEQTGRLFTIF